jgi:hypothetical protein
METQHGDGQYEATTGDGVQPAELGHAEPDTGLGESAESEIPTGVDGLTDEQIQKAQEAGPADGGDEGGEGGGGDDAIDVAAIMEDDAPDASGDDDADASGDVDADASGDAEADASGDDADADASVDDADADASGGDVESETEGNAADDAGDDATEMTEPEAAVAPDTGEA